MTNVREDGTIPQFEKPSWKNLNTYRTNAQIEGGCAALQSALARRPNLIISDVIMPGMNGWRLCRKLRAQRQFADTPFMFLTRLACPESRRHSFRLGADDVLHKPVQPRELIVRVRGALRRSRLSRPVQRPLAPPRGVSGAIEDISLASLLVLLEMERKHGLLVVTNGYTGERCRVFLRDGRIVGAALDDCPALRHAELLYHALTWQRGTFAFKALPVEMRDEVGATTTQLLMEASRRTDEADRELADLGLQRPR
jgi:CheY-like chemotaxis protein